MIYRIPKTSEIDEILVMKNNVKKRVVESGLPMWLNGYPLDEMIVEDVHLGDARVIELDGKIIGFELELLTNRPYALQEPISMTIKNLQENGIKRIVSKSDEEGYIYPEMTIYIEQDGDLTIYNSLEDRTMHIANCTSGEVIKINYPMIESSLESHKIQNDFNWKFFRISRTYQNNVNEINISIPCTIQLTYSPVVKIGI